MKLYNTMTRQKEEFVPMEEGKVKMYVCGPTVYDYIHIGNARPYVVFDTVRRYLEYKGYEVTYVQNFTDVDDKIINRANKEGKTMAEISNKYIEEAFRDADGLNVKRATVHPRVTEEMDGIIAMVQTLIDKGFAYEDHGTVYYDTKKFPEYGKLSRKNLDELIAGASERVAIDDAKKNPTDFVLWKPKKEGEPFWKSPWAYLLYFILSAAGIGYIFYRFRKQITDKQRRQLEILEAEKEKEIYHAKIDFFTNIAHEIRTPLTLIKGPLENILHKENIDRNTIRENLDVMERNTLRLLDLTNQLLDFRKTETKGFRLNFMDCNISQLIRDTYIRFNPAAQQNGLKFQTDLPEQDFNAPVDKEALTKILSNLFNNAVKYATSSIHVSLIPPCGMKEPGYFSIMVSNDGHPIPHDMQEKIFQPFVQIKQTSGGQRTAGTGIGLPLARSLAELHKGKLYLKDREEICFCVELPVDQEKAIQLQKDSTISQTGNMQTVIRQHSTNICILVVEDDPEMQNFICAQLETVYCVIRASNGKEALQVLSEKTISLIVSDVMMPEMDGFELCHTLKTDIEHSHIPIILLTAKVTMQSKIEGIELGADDYIEKPFSTEYLLARIANLLSNQDKLRHAFTSSPFVNAKTIALSKADENFLDKLIEVIQKNISEPDFNVDILAEKMNMSRSSLHRKIKGIAQITPNEFIQLERLKMAAQLIQSGEYRINEVCYIVGFNSSSYFAKCFQKQFGVLPKDFCKNGS